MDSIPSDIFHDLPTQQLSEPVKVLTVWNHLNQENIPYNIQTTDESYDMVDFDTWTVFSDTVPDVETTVQWVWDEQFWATMNDFRDDFTDHHTEFCKSCHQPSSDPKERFLDEGNVLFLSHPTMNQPEAEESSSQIDQEVTTCNYEQVWEEWKEEDIDKEQLSFPNETCLCGGIYVESSIVMPTEGMYCSLPNVPQSETEYSLLPAELVPIPSEYITIPADLPEYGLPFDDAVVPVINWSQRNCTSSDSSDEEQAVPDMDRVPLGYESSQACSTCSTESALVLKPDFELACDVSLRLVPVADIDLVPVLEQELMVRDIEQVLDVPLQGTDLSTQEWDSEQVTETETYSDLMLLVPEAVPSRDSTQSPNFNAEMDRPINSCSAYDHTVPVWAIEE